LNIAGCVLVYAGLLATGLGLVSLLKPLRFLRIPTRKTALAVSAAGLLPIVLGMSLPAPVNLVTRAESHLDAWVPEWQFEEFHSLRMRATSGQIYRAIRQVTADEIFLFRTLTWIRNPMRRGEGENILAPSRRPILDVALAGGFHLLADDPPREIVIGTLVVRDGLSRPTDESSLRALLRRPGNAFAVMNFRIHDEGNGWCVVTTETRTYTTDNSARRRFARYWRVIYPGSSLLRYAWLRAIRRRAEGAPAESHRPWIRLPMPNASRPLPSSVRPRPIEGMAR